MPVWGDVPKSVSRHFPSPPEQVAFDSDEEFEEARGGWQERIGRPLAFAMARHHAAVPKYLYSISPNGGVVFAPEARARFVSTIFEAMSSSDTWGDFRRAMPADEYEKLMRESFDDVEEVRPDDGDEFESLQLLGVGDGDYPPWLQAEMANIVSPRVLQQFGKYTVTTINGGYWHIPPENLEPACEALRALGYAVEDGDPLIFH